MRHLTATICLTVAVLFGNSLLNATSAQKADAAFIESEKEKIKVRQREAAKRLALLKVETTGNINDFKTKAPELCREKYSGNRQNAKMEFEKDPAWAQALSESIARRQKEIYQILISQVERGKRICAKEMIRVVVWEENTKNDAAFRDEGEMQLEEKDRLRKLELSEKKRNEKLRQQEWERKKKSR